MLTHCPHCGRPVSCDETLVRTSLGWTPTQCASGDGPLAAIGSEVVLNRPFWYCTAMNGIGKRIALTGPHSGYDSAREAIGVAKGLAFGADPDAPFWAYGVSSCQHDTVRVAFPNG